MLSHNNDRRHFIFITTIILVLVSNNFNCQEIDTTKLEDRKRFSLDCEKAHDKYRKLYGLQPLEHDDTVSFPL